MEKIFYESPSCLIVQAIETEVLCLSGQTEDYDVVDVSSEY